MVSVDTFLLMLSNNFDIDFAENVWDITYLNGPIKGATLLETHRISWVGNRLRRDINWPHNAQ